VRPNPAQAWWEHIKFLADDKMAGRDTGSGEHRRAADYVAAAFKRAGLKPAGTKGYLQPVQFVSRRVVEERMQSRARQKRPSPNRSCSAMKPSSACASRTRRSVEAPLVFVGYGLTIPEAQHDDLPVLI
jgi:hypothetical protein